MFLLNMVLFDGLSAWLDLSFWGGYLTNFFVLVIWVLFFAALFISWRYVRRLREQRVALQQVEANADGVSMAQESDAEFVRRGLLKDVPAGSVIAERVSVLHWMGQHGGDFEQGALAESLAAREGSHISFPKYVASTLVLLGLCGAIYGLSNLVRQMGPELRKMQELSRQASTAQTATSAAAQNNSLTSIQESVGTLIETMAGSLEHTRGAFAASLTGIALSIVLLFVNWYVARSQMAFLAEVEGLTSTQLLPLFKPHSQAYELSGAVSSFNAGAEHAASMASSLDQLVGKAFESLQMLFSIVRKFEQGAAAIRESQQSVADAQMKMLEMAQQFTGLTKQIEQHQAGSKEDISSAVSAVTSNNEFIRYALDDWGKRHEKVLQQLERITTQWSNESKDAKKETRDLLAQDIKQFRAQVIAGFKSQQKFNQEQLARMLEEQKQYVADLQAAVLNGQGHKELVQGVNEIFTKEREAFSAGLREFIEPQQRSLTEQFEKIIRHQETLVIRLEKLGNGDAPASIVAAKVRPAYQNSLETLANEQRETNRAARQISHYAERLIAVSVIFVSGAGSVAVVGLGSAAAWMLGFWPTSVAGGVATLIGLLMAGGITSYILFSRLLQDSDD